MSTVSRRDFMGSAGISALAVAMQSARTAQSAIGPDDKFDLVIRAATCSTPANRCAAGVTLAFVTD